MLLLLVLLPAACFPQRAAEREPLPEILWPLPPERPRIVFVNSFSRPEDMDMKEGGLKSFFSLFYQQERKDIVKPYGIETDGAGRHFVVDTSEKKVHVFDKGNMVYYSFPENETSFKKPIDIAVGKDGYVYVTDSVDGVVKIFKENGKKFVGEIGRHVLGRPSGLAINEKKNELMVVDTLSSQVVIYHIDNKEFKGTIGRDGSEEGAFHYPTNIFVSRDGDIFISDSLNFRIQVFSADREFIRSFGKAGNGPGFFSRPRGVAVDSDGNIYVVDALFDNVQVFDSEGMLLMDFGGPGYGYGEFWLPSGIYIDSKDRIYVSDTYNKRVQVFQYIKNGEL
jgi:DNA-binding beta-propeller fold protein YncE